MCSMYANFLRLLLLVQFTAQFFNPGARAPRKYREHIYRAGTNSRIY